MAQNETQPIFGKSQYRTCTVEKVAVKISAALEIIKKPKVNNRPVGAKILPFWSPCLCSDKYLIFPPFSELIINRN
jgi:hypothetical protein